MPVKCLVVFCENRKGLSDKGVHYFSVTKARADVWLKHLGITQGGVSSHNVVCSDHFLPEMLIKKGAKVCLTKDAVPTLKLTRKGDVAASGVSLTVSSTARLSDYSSLGGASESILQDCSIINSYEVNTSNARASTSTGGNPALSSTTDIEEIKGGKRAFSSTTDSDGLKGEAKKRRKIIKTFHNYSASPRRITAKLKTVQKEKLDVCKKLKYSTEKVKRLKIKVRSLNDVIKELKKKKFNSDDALEFLQKCTDDIPFEILRRHILHNKKGKKSRTEYPPQIRKFAMTLQFYSSKAYNYVRSTFQLNLPSPSTIQSWFANINCEPGFCESAINTLKQKVYDDTLIDKKTLCSLMLDEVAIKKQIDFFGNKTWGYVDYGTEVDDDTRTYATEALVLMLVSLNSHWKIPIAYFFIKSITGAETANIIINALEIVSKIGVCVSSITCDGPSAHFAMASHLGAKIDDINNLQTYFLHPVTKERVFIIFDACHMLKLLRNNWATLEQIKNNNGEIIDFTYVKKLYEIQEEEMLRFGNKLRKSHIEWTKQKMKVNLAAQTLSKSVADAIEFLKDDIKHPQFKNAGPTINFIHIADRLFDLLNSRNIFAKGCSTPLKPANEKYWKPILQDSLEYLKHLTHKNGTPLHMTKNKTPIRGFIITGLSAIGIYEEFVMSGSLKYLLTYKLSQDHLELFFCSIRYRNGWNNNPTAFQFYHSFRRLALEHDLKNVNGNCTLQDSTNLLKVSSRRSTVEIGIEEISNSKRFDMPIETFLENDHDYDVPHISELSVNVVVYISGFVVKSIRKKIKCIECIDNLERVENVSKDDTGFSLVTRKNRGGLIKPSEDVVNICTEVELNIRKIMLITNNQMPRDKLFVEKFCLKLSIKMYSNAKYFKQLQEHIFNNEIGIENHVVKLVKLIVATYSKIRFFAIAKKQTEAVRGDLIRKDLSKLILFKHQ